MRWIGMLLILFPVLAYATTGGQSCLLTNTYSVTSEPFEYVNDSTTHDIRRPTRHEEAREVTRLWTLYVRAYRIIRRHAFMVKQIQEVGRRRQFFGETELTAVLTAAGFYGRKLKREPSFVYTLQIAAYRQPRALRRFLARFRHTFTSMEDAGVGFFDSIPKQARLIYGSEGTESKPDFLYVTSQSRLQRIRYGVYLSRGDARSDARAWQQRYHVTPVIYRVPLTVSLVKNMIWGPLPGLKWYTVE